MCDDGVKDGMGYTQRVNTAHFKEKCGGYPDD